MSEIIKVSIGMNGILDVSHECTEANVNEDLGTCLFVSLFFLYAVKVNLWTHMFCYCWHNYYFFQV